MGFSDSWTSRHHWESQKSREHGGGGGGGVVVGGQLGGGAWTASIQLVPAVIRLGSGCSWEHRKAFYGRVKQCLCSRMPSPWLPMADLNERDNPWF